MKKCKTIILLPAFLPLFLGACEHNQNPVSVVKPSAEQFVVVTTKETPERTLVAEIFMLDEKGNGLKKIADGFEAQVSPDGKKALFTGRMGNAQRLDILAVELANGSLQNLTNTPTGRTDADGRWSPDGAYIVYQSDTGPPRWAYVSS